MTTIATDGKSMAGDGQTNVNGTTTSFKARKVFRMKCGRIYGFCGSSGDGDSHRRWLEGGCEGKLPELDSSFGFIVLNRDGSVQQGGCDGFPDEVSAPTAIGSGMDIAIGAMDAGATPSEAIAITSSRNPHTGGVILSLELEPALCLVAGSDHA